MAEHRTITVATNGPYLVAGPVPLSVVSIETNAAGESVAWDNGKAFPVSEKFALCRCGASRNKPFCDGAHAKNGFDGTETASREPFIEQAEVLDGSAMQLVDAEALCAYVRFCDPNGRIWNQVEDTDDPNVRAHFIQQV